MKLNTESFDKVEGNLLGGENQTSFMIKDSPHLFNMLSKKIYSNPTLAVVRETICNAIDSHIMAGNLGTTKIELELPNEFSSNFVVKDYGVGLSPEDVVSLYTTYGASNKQASNSLIGGFGIGSKAPFALTDSFQVESRYNGMRYLFHNLTQEGKPICIKLLEEPTKEPNGLTVTVGISDEHLGAFRNALKMFFKGTSAEYYNLPAYTEYKFFNPKEYGEVIEMDEGIKLYLNPNKYRYDTDIDVKMGEVIYTLRIDNSWNLSMPTRSIDCIEAPIGLFPISASRETIEVCNDTKDKLQQILDKYFDLYCEQVLAPLPNTTYVQNLLINDKIEKGVEDRKYGRIARGKYLNPRYLKVESNTTQPSLSQSENQLSQYLKYKGKRKSSSGSKRFYVESTLRLDLSKGEAFIYDPEEKLTPAILKWITEDYLKDFGWITIINQVRKDSDRRLFDIGKRLMFASDILKLYKDRKVSVSRRDKIARKKDKVSSNYVVKTDRTFAYVYPSNVTWEQRATTAIDSYWIPYSEKGSILNTEIPRYLGARVYFVPKNTPKEYFTVDAKELTQTEIAHLKLRAVNKQILNNLKDREVFAKYDIDLESIPMNIVRKYTAYRQVCHYDTTAGTSRMQRYLKTLFDNYQEVHKTIIQAPNDHLFDDSPRIQAAARQDRLEYLYKNLAKNHHNIKKKGDVYYV